MCLCPNSRPKRKSTFAHRKSYSLTCSLLASRFSEISPKGQKSKRIQPQKNRDRRVSSGFSQCIPMTPKYHSSGSSPDFHHLILGQQRCRFFKGGIRSSGLRHQGGGGRDASRRVGSLTSYRPGRGLSTTVAATRFSLSYFCLFGNIRLVLMAQ
jgi:hypothetical protein